MFSNAEKEHRPLKGRTTILLANNCWKHSAVEYQETTKGKFILFTSSLISVSSS
jgi:hypothetical protein